MEPTSEDANLSKTFQDMNIKSVATSFFTKCLTIGMVWGWGYMNWSFAWLIPPVILSVWKSAGQEQGKLKRLMAQATVMAKEKELITSRIDELPSWVYFPDFDRAEWLNRILAKLWPNVNHYAREILKETIEPSIVECLVDYKMKGFKFERMVLGRNPPKIYGIKAYDINTSRNEIIMDADIIYAGDCDITFLVGNIKAGIRDFQFRGIMRVVMKPLIQSIPLVGGVQVFFLNNPVIDYDLVGAADVLDLPGFNDLLRKIIAQQISARVVLPNKISVSLSQHVPAEVLKMPEPEGILRVHVIEAKHLMKKDISVLGKGKSDPYAVINVGAQEYRTKTIDNTVNPQWDFWCEFVVDEGYGPHCKLVANLFDKDNTGVDDPLGRATIEVNRAKKKGTVDTWISLEFAKHGMIHLRLTWLQLSKEVNDLSAAIKETQQLRVTSMSTALLTLYIDSAKNLPRVKGNKQPDVYLEANVGNKQQRTSTMRSCDPVWEQGFTFLIGNPDTDTLHFKINDEKTCTTIGTMTYNLSSLMEKNNLEIQQQPFQLDNATSDSKVVMSMVLRILKYEQPQSTEEVDEEEENDISVLKERIERQESDLSNSSGVPPSPLKKQPSKESVHSTASSSASAIGMPNVTADSVEEPIVATANKHGLVYRSPSVTSYAGEAKLGRIQLTVRYSVQRQKLVVTVHKIANLPLPDKDPNNVPDPYVKLYLLPDRNKESKRKTAVVKDNCNPIFDEQFEYTISQGDLNTLNLEVSVCTHKAWHSTGSNIMGQVLLKLTDVDVEQANTRWFDLVPETKT